MTMRDQIAEAEAELTAAICVIIAGAVCIGA